MFRDELQSLLNKYSKENVSNTPDWILAEFLDDCLQAYDLALQKRAKWYDSWMKNSIGDSHKNFHAVNTSAISNENIVTETKENEMNGVKIISPVLNRQKAPPVKESASPRVDDTVEGQYDKAGKSNKGPTQLPKKAPAVVQKKNPLGAMKRNTISTGKVTGPVKSR